MDDSIDKKKKKVYNLHNYEEVGTALLSGLHTIVSSSTCGMEERLGREWSGLFTTLCRLSGRSLDRPIWVQIASASSSTVSTGMCLERPLICYIVIKNDCNKTFIPLTKIG